jgi:hypothetical protein
MALLRFDHLHPPFDNVKIGAGGFGRRRSIRVYEFPTIQRTGPVASFFTCGTPTTTNDAGSTALTGKRDFDTASRLIAEAGYQGEKIVILDGVDQPSTHTQALIGFGPAIARTSRANQRKLLEENDAGDCRALSCDRDRAADDRLYGPGPLPEPEHRYRR